MYDLDLVLKIDKNGNKREDTKIKIGGKVVGEDFFFVSGPCSVEDEEMIERVAEVVKDTGGALLRGGTYKLRTSPYTFQGLGPLAMEYLINAGKKYNLPIITEVVDTRDVAKLVEEVDAFQIGTRNMLNYPLIIETAKTGKPIILKRGMNTNINEWFNSAEYILSMGNPNVILCERGLRTVEYYTRNTLDLSAVAIAKNMTHLPVIVDPSHATGRSDLVEQMSLASVMAGADGLMIEVHPNPEKALSDSEQQVDLEQYVELVEKINKTVKFRNELYK